MPVSAHTLRLLMDAGLAGETLIAVVESIDADCETKMPVRSAAAERQARFRDRHRNERDVTRDVISNVTSPPKEITPLSSLRSDRAREFAETFWPKYPHKVGKPAAERAFIGARKTADLDAIMAGLARYVATKPEGRNWLNPATFLNQKRWADEPAGHSNGNGSYELNEFGERPMSWPERIAFSQSHDGYWPESLWGARDDVPKEYQHLFEATA